MVPSVECQIYNGFIIKSEFSLRFIFILVCSLLLLFIIIAIIFFSINRVPDRSVEQLKPQWAQHPSQFIDISGMQLHLRDEGPRDDAIPIVLLHGTSSSLHTWDGWVNALKDDRRVIRFDLPAFGLTGPTLDNNYSIENYSRIVIEVLDKLKVDRAILVGNSLGGYVSWATAVFYPDRVAQLVLIDSSGYPFQAESIPIGFRIASTPILNKLMQQVLPRGLVESSVKNVYGNPDLVSPELVDRYFDLTTRAGNRQALADLLPKLRSGQLVSRLSELKLPTLIIWGEQDRLIPPEIADQFHHDIIGSQLVRYNELGHVPQEEDPLKTVKAFKAFLAQQPKVNR
ncbi:alpha/beta hydrolase [Shewanella glacialimarina]|nr:alpha/beta hydrolase [Shewanella glacialimarina]